MDMESRFTGLSLVVQKSQPISKPVTKDFMLSNILDHRALQGKKLLIRRVSKRHGYRGIVGDR